ncbi:MAG: hypothetical protein ABIW76_11325, partial [Fibrobacteria bacterium]
FGCFAGPSEWQSDCALGKIKKTGAQWGDLVKAAFPGYAGPRPKMQLWHGTGDATLVFANFAEEIKEWTNVLGVSETPTATFQNSPKSGWIRTQYANPSTQEVMVEAIQETGEPHNLQIVHDNVVKFFGLDLAVSAASRVMKAPFASSLRATRNGAGTWEIEVVGPPGRITLDLSDLRGMRRARLLEGYSGTGRMKVQWDGRIGSATPGRTSAYILSLRVDGAPVQSRVVVLHP